ncbi:hypothetical protein ACQKD2_19470, partial [Stenotrophomonas sp. NPDC077426]
MTVTANQVLRPRGPQIERLTDTRAKVVIEPLFIAYLGVNVDSVGARPRYADDNRQVTLVQAR